MHRSAIVLAALVCLMSCTSAPEAPSASRASLAQGGKLRAGIDLGNGVVATRDAGW